jgi:hypothetical protein
MIFLLRSELDVDARYSSEFIPVGVRQQIAEVVARAGADVARKPPTF